MTAAVASVGGAAGAGLGGVVDFFSRKKGGPKDPTDSDDDDGDGDNMELKNLESKDLMPR